MAGHVFKALRNHLRNSLCSVFISDMKLRVEDDMGILNFKILRLLKIPLFFRLHQ